MRYFSAIVFSAVGTLAVGFHVVVAPSIVESLKCCHSSIKYSASSILPVLPVRQQYQYLWVRPSTSQSSTPCPKYFTVLYYTVLYCTVLCCTVLYCTVLYCIVLYCTTVVLYCTILYCTVLHCTVLQLYCTVLYCTALYCIVLYCTCLLYTSPSPRDRQKSRMPSSA